MPEIISASIMTYIVSSGALNSTHSLAWNYKWNRWYGIQTPNQFSSPCCKTNQSLNQNPQFQHLNTLAVQGWSSSEHQPCWSGGHWDNVITLTSDDSRNIGDDSHNSMDVSRTCANRTLR